MKQFSFFLPILLLTGFVLPTPESITPSQKSLGEKVKEKMEEVLKIKTTEPCLVTIFVHGTLKPAEVSLSTINEVMHNKIENTLYSITLEYMRANKYLHRNTPTQGLGLVYINPLNEVCQSGAQTVRNLFELTYNFYKTEYPHRRYYTFGWNGLLNMKERYVEAQKLYRELEKEVVLLRSKDLEPHIHIIAYSHGGNVALNLAKVKEESSTSSPLFSVEQLILLATPIQKETDYLVGDISFFKKSYLFFSTEDHVQTSDFFSTQKELFSRRKFTSRENFKLPSTLTQVRIRLTKRINRSKMMRDESTEVEAILSEPHIRCLHMDPSHTEFWNLKWGNAWYRKSLPIAPLPVIAFVPTITYLLEHFAPNAPAITFDYCPSINGARLIEKKHTPIVVPVLNSTVISHMNELVKRCTPEDFSLEEQNRQEQLALKQAYETLKKDKKVLKKKSRRKLTTSYLDLSRKMRTYYFPQL